MDIGVSINPGIDRGQIVGGFIQGMGWVTTEELKYSPKGELLSHSPTTYKIPNIGDVPRVFNVDAAQPGNAREPDNEQSRRRAAAAAGHLRLGRGEECAAICERRPVLPQLASGDE